MQNIIITNDSIGSSGPASMRSTRMCSGSVSLEASTQPADPAPTIIKSNDDPSAGYHNNTIYYIFKGNNFKYVESKFVYTDTRTGSGSGQ